MAVYFCILVNDMTIVLNKQKRCGIMWLIRLFIEKEMDIMQEIIESIMNTVDKKKVQSLCKKILKKCSFGSRNDLYNVSDLATWLYIYGYYEDALAVCDTLSGLEFSGNYDIWWHADYTMCLKARILRENNILEGRKELLERINEHRHSELYINLVDWYRNTVNVNIKSDDDYNPKRINDGWRMAKLEHAIMYREGGGHPIPDEEFEADIREIVELLKQVK